MADESNDAAQEQVSFVKNPFDLLFAFCNSISKRHVTQVEFSDELHGIAAGLKRRRRSTQGKSASKRVGYSEGQISQRLKVDYFKRNAADPREPGNTLSREDEYVLNSKLQKESRREFSDIFAQRKAIEKKIGYRFPRKDEDHQNTLEKKLSNLRGVWQFLHVSLTKTDMERLKDGTEEDSDQWMIRDGIIIFFGFGAERIKTLVLGTGRAWTGEAWIPSSKIYVELRIPRTNEHGYLSLHDPGWLSDPLEEGGVPAILDGVRSGSVSDNSYSAKPVVACRCVLRKLHHASEQFLADDAVIDRAFVKRYKALCRYAAWGDLQRASKSRAEILALEDGENVTAERDYELKLVLKRLMSSSGKIDFPIIGFHSEP